MPSLLQQSLALLRAPGNQLAFAVRKRLRWSRGTIALGNEAKDGLFATLPIGERQAAEAIAADLARRYDLAALRSNSTRLVHAENLALLDRLTALLGADELPCGDAGVVSAIDVGCGAFAYATALHRWLRGPRSERARAVELRGVELDGFGVYRDGRSRADHARAHVALAGSEVSFEVGDFTRMTVPPQDVVSLLFPFLSAYPLLRWGLPLSCLRPAQIVRQAVLALRPGGLLVIASQTEGEFTRMQELLAEQPMALVRKIPFATNLVPYADRTRERVGSLWARLFDSGREAGPST